MKRGLRPLLGLAVDGLRRKWGRNLLTMSGVFLGVLALTLIVSLGNGIQHVIGNTVSGEANLKQIGLSGGFGNRIDTDTDIQVEGVQDPKRQARLRRALLARRRPGNFIGRRAQRLDQAVLDQVAALPHVAEVTPIVLDRYALTLGEHTREAAATLGVDTRRQRYADRLIHGRYFSTPDAREVLVHEVLGYQWGYRTVESLKALVGKTLTLQRLGDTGALAGTRGMSRRILEEVMASGLLETLSDEERAALPGIVRKVGEAVGSQVQEEDVGTYEVQIVGIVREMEPGDAFNVIEDGNAFQVDLFLPQATADTLFQASTVNRDLGYARALVVVDEAQHAPAVEETLREKGFTAFSVASVIQRVETVVGAITIIVAFLTGIALLVAALGIVNTMVTSVLERRREIGLWKAVGATDGQVRVVFLLEAAGLGLLGGLLGLGMARLLMIPGNAIAADLIAERATIPLSTGVFQMPGWLPWAAVGLATLVAMLASLIPAARAARIDPVRALRHD